MRDQQLANAHRIIDCVKALWRISRAVKVVTANVFAAWLEKNGYHAEKVQPVDLFPRTKHCEVVSCYTKTV